MTVVERLKADVVSLGTPSHDEQIGVVGSILGSVSLTRGRRTQDRLRESRGRDVPYARPHGTPLTLAVCLLVAGPLACANRGMRAPVDSSDGGGTGGGATLTDGSLDAPATGGGGMGGSVGTGGTAGGTNTGGGAGHASTGGTGGTGTGGMGTGGMGTGGMGTGGNGTGGTGTGGTGTGGTGTGGMGTGGMGTGGMGTGGMGTGGNGGAGGVSDGGSGGSGGQTLPSMFAYYPFDQTAGPTITDASGNGRNGTLSGAATFPAGVIGNGLSLPGASGDYVTLPSAFIQTLTNITITLWVNVYTDQTWQRVFDFGSSQNVYMFLTSHAGGANARFSITTSGNTMEQQLNGTAVLPTGAWTHVGIVLGSNGGTLYINGAVVATNTSLTLRPSDLGATADNYIGRSQFSVDPYFNGEIDDMRIYASALTAAQITTIYNAR